MDMPDPKTSHLVVFTDMATGQKWVVDTRPDPLMRDDAWTTADGTTLALGEMAESHISNVINFLRRRARQFHRRAIEGMFRSLEGPFAPGGDWAQDSFDAEFSHLIDADPIEWLEEMPIIGALKAELVLRCEPWGVA
jgi:hypothetical protein